jgi:tetratricopeptide (TPR) repeat protein
LVKGHSLWVLVVLSLALLGSPAWAGKDRDSVLDRGLRDNEPYSYVLSQRAEASGPAEAKVLLEEAIRQSPDLPVLYFKLSEAVLAASPWDVFEGISHAVEGLKAYRRSFWWSMSLAGLLYVSILGSLLISLAAVALIRLPMELPLLAHDISEDPRKLIVPALLLLISFLGPLFFFAGGLCIIGLYLRKTDKAVVYVSLLTIALSPYLLRPVDMFYSSSTPENRAIVAVNEGRDNSYALQVLEGHRDYASMFSYALALKREGFYGKAAGLYEEMARGGPNQMVYTNLGNAYLAAGLTERAKDFYRMAEKMRPSPKTLYNLSQVYRYTLDFQTGDRYFLDAAKLDSDLVSGFTAVASSNPNRFVMDETIPMGELLERTWAGRKGVIDPFPVSPGAAAAIAVVMLAGFLLADRRTPTRASRCTRCNRILCPRCTQGLQWRQTCPDCYNSLVRLVDVDPKERVTKLLAVHERKSRIRAAVRLLSFAPPGIAQVYTGRVLAGFILLWLFTFPLLAAALNPLFFTGLSSFRHGWLNPLLFLAMAVLYLASNISIRRRLTRGWL